MNIQVSKTPGGRLVFLYRKKQGKIPRCGDTGVKLKGVSSPFFHSEEKILMNFV